MKKVVLEGPFPLEAQAIEESVRRGSTGVYVLCHEVESISLPTYMLNVVKVHYVGRSDTDLSNCLKEKLGLYPKFKFVYTDHAQAAFNLECKLWHNYGGPHGDLDNKRHPKRLEGTDWDCPKCHLS